MALFTCPTCGHSQAVDDKHVGKNATCPKCKTQGPINKAVDDDLATVRDCGEMSVRKASGGQAGLYLVRYGGGIGPPVTRPSLNLEWIVIDNPHLPVAFASVEGVRAVTEPAENRYWYYAKFDVQLEDSVTAWESRFLIFNVWGDHVRTLSYTKVHAVNREDMALASGSWYLGSGAEGEEHLASIGYIARVRTKEGKVLHADTKFILREAQRFSEKFTEEDLEPQAPKKD